MNLFIKGLHKLTKDKIIEYYIDLDSELARIENLEFSYYDKIQTQSLELEKLKRMYKETISIKVKYHIALEFYADKKNWQAGGGRHRMTTIKDDHNYSGDSSNDYGGLLARKCLGVEE